MDRWIQAKYLRPYRENDNPGDVVWREKKREDQLRELGNEMVRVITPDFNRPQAVEHRFRQAFARAQQLRRRAA